MDLIQPFNNVLQLHFIDNEVLHITSKLHLTFFAHAMITCSGKSIQVAAIDLRAISLKNLINDFKIGLIFFFYFLE